MTDKTRRMDPIGLGVRVLTRFAGSPLTARLKLHGPASALIRSGAQVGFGAVNGAGRQFKAVRNWTSSSRGSRPPRQDLFDLTPSDEQQMIAETMEQVAAELLRPNAEAAEADGAPSAALQTQANELGVLAMAIPEALGGAMSERSPVTSALIAEHLAHGDMGIAVSLLATPSVALLLTDYGNAAQQDAFLAPMTAEENAPTASLAITEERALFAPHDLGTRVRQDGGTLRLSGTKSLVVNGSRSDFYVVAARSPEGAPGLYIVEATAPGIQVEAQPAMGLRAAGLSRVRFDDVALRDDAALELGEGDYDCIIASARAAWCALAVGTATAVRDYCIPYANERQAFGEPISHRQSVAFMIANMGIERDGLRLATLRAASRLEQGEDALREVQLARTLAARHAMQIASDGVQIFGGHGFVKEYPVERWYRDLRATALMEGAVLL